jgi:hypothetical protein
MQMFHPIYLKAIYNSEAQYGSFNQWKLVNLKAGKALHEGDWAHPHDT